jgi:hypothetical protein
VKNAPAVTARRATKRIVRAPALLVLAAIVETTAPETTAPETQAAIVVAEQVVRVATMRLIDPVGTCRHRIGHAVTAIDHTRHVPHVTAIDLTRRVPLAMAQPARRGLLVTAPIRRALRATGIRVLVVTATTVLAIRAETATPRPGPHVLVAIDPTLRAPRAMAILLVGHRALAETDPIRRAQPGTARARTDLEAIVRIVRARIVHTAISRVATGNPMGESAARFARR